MTGDPQDRERLARTIAEAVPTWTIGQNSVMQIADALLAAGVTLPPAPKPPLLTEQQVGEVWDRVMPPDWDRWRNPHSLADCGPLLDFARAAAEEAIRGRVKDPAVLALFGMEGE